MIAGFSEAVAWGVRITRPAGNPFAGWGVGSLAVTMLAAADVAGFEAAAPGAVIVASRTACLFASGLAAAAMLLFVALLWAACLSGRDLRIARKALAAFPAAGMARFLAAFL